MTFDLEWSTNVVNAQIKPSLKPKDGGVSIAYQTAIMLPVDQPQGKSTLTVAFKKALPEGAFKFYVYLGKVGESWSNRKSAMAQVIVSSDTATAEPTPAPTTAEPTNAKTAEPTQKPTSTPKPDCPDTAIEYFYPALGKRMTLQRLYVLQKFLADTNEECAAKCLEWNTDPVNADGPKCKAFERRSANTVCNIKAVTPGDHNIVLVDNKNFDTYMLQGLDCGEDTTTSVMTTLEVTELTTVAPVKETAGPDGNNNGNGDGNGNNDPVCPPYEERFERITGQKFKMAKKNTVQVDNARMIGVTDVAGCAEMCINEGDVCKSFEYKARDSTCTLKTITSGDVGTVIKPKVDIYVRKAGACMGEPTPEVEETPKPTAKPTPYPTTSAPTPMPTEGTTRITTTTTTNTGPVVYKTEESCPCNVDMFEPVCADGIDYFNPCYAFCDNQIVYALGKCRDQGIVVVEVTTVQTTEEPVTEQESTGAPPTTEAADSCFCDLAVYQPVCGTKTYHSMCFAICANDLSFSSGVCATSVTETTATQTYTTTTTRTTVTEGPQCFCDTTYEPVCVNNGVTYQNPCFAACFKEFTYVAGSCGSCGAIEWSNSIEELPSLSQLLDMGCSERVIGATFTATDKAGEQASTDASFTFVDTTAPVLLTRPANIIVEASRDDASDEMTNWLNTCGGANIFDNGGPSIITHADLEFTSLDASSDCSDKSAVAHFTVADSCGNEVTTSATVVSKDTTPPMMSTEISPLTVQTQLSDAEIASSIEAWLKNNGNGIAEDAISSMVTWSHGGVSFQRSQPGTECANKFSNVTFSVGDSCGNIRTIDSVLRVADTTAPTFTMLSQNFTVESDGMGNAAKMVEWLESYGLAAATDEVTPSDRIEWSYTNTEHITTGADRCQNSVVNAKFFATDICGNVATSYGEFKIVDTTKPELKREASPLTVEADGEGNVAEIEAWLKTNANADALDAISNVFWTNDVETTEFVAVNPDFQQDTAGTKTVTFTATDFCGNAIASSAVLTVMDTIAPVVTSTASDVTVEADDNENTVGFSAWLRRQGGAIATDASHSIKWSNGDISRASFEIINQVSQCNDEQVTVTFVATDPSGNTAETTATYTIVDTTAPVLQVKAESHTMESEGADANQAAIDEWIASNGGAVVSDARKGMIWTHKSTKFVSHDDAGSCGNRTMSTRFTADDGCGNIVMTRASFTIIDTKGPEIVTPGQDSTIQAALNGNEASIQEWLDNHGGAVILDKDDEHLDWSNTALELHVVDPNAVCKVSKGQVEFTAVDDCGFTIKTTAQVTIADTEPPSFVTEAETISVSPENGPVLITQSGVVDLVNDNTAALLQWLASNGGATATDIFSGDEITWSYEVPFFQARSSNTLCSDKFIEVDFTATDKCGFKSVSTAQYLVVDEHKPSIASEAVTAVINKDIDDVDAKLKSWLSRNGNAIAIDSGSTAGLTWSYEAPTFALVTPGSACGDDIATVSFVATDTCDNAVQSTASFSRVDTTPPVIEFKAIGVTFEHDGSGNKEDVAEWVKSYGGASATDTIGEVTWTYNEPEFALVRPNTDCPNEVATVTFTADDGCGNTASTSATIQLVDNALPTLVTTPKNKSVLGDGTGNVADLQEWLANRAGAISSKPLTWAFNPPIFDIATCSGRSAIVTFTGSDVCGHKLETTATFTIEDVQPPQFVIEAQDVTVQADWTGNQADLQKWIDERGGAVVKDVGSTTLTWSHRFEEDDWFVDEGLPTCTTDKHRTISFIAIDTCGQMAVTSATFTVKDMAPPSVGCNSLIELRCDYRCDENTAFDEFLHYNGHLCVEDVSGYEMTHNFPEKQFPNFLLDVCGTAGTVTFTFTDGCGNTISESVDYSVAHETPQCDACTMETKGARLTSLTFLWVPGFNAGETSDAVIATNNGAVTTTTLTDQLKAGDTFTVLLTSVMGEVPTRMSVRINGIKIFIDLSCKTNLSLTSNFDFGNFGFMGQLKLAAFTRSDGSSSDSCGDNAKCDTGLCLDINVCADGAYSLESLTLMYLGENPTGDLSAGYTQPSKGVTITEPGPQMASPIKMYLSKYNQTAFDLNKVKVGDEITVYQYEKSLGAGFRFPGYINIRIDNGASRVKFDTTCKSDIPLRVGDRFGSILVTGYKSDHAKQCHIGYRLEDFVQGGPGAMAQAGDDQADTVDDSSGGVGIVMLGIGFGLVAVVLLAAAVLLNKRTKSFNWNDDSSGSQMTHSSFSSSTIAKPKDLKSRKPGVTAMDLIDHHHFNEDDSATIVSSSSVSQKDGTLTGHALEWDGNNNEDPMTSSQYVASSIAASEDNSVNIV